MVLDSLMKMSWRLCFILIACCFLLELWPFVFPFSDVGGDRNVIHNWSFLTGLFEPATKANEKKQTPSTSLAFVHSSRGTV
jgi:hypothetical protein